MHVNKNFVNVRHWKKLILFLLIILLKQNQELKNVWNENEY